MRIKVIFLSMAFIAFDLMNASEYKYEVISPLMGKLGTININTNIKDNTYEVKAKAVTEGMAAFLTKHRQESYISKGHGKKSNYITDLFKITRNMKNKKEIDKYIFEHNSSIVLKHRLRWKHNHLKKDDTKPLKYHTDKDLAAVYLNIIPVLSGTFGVKKSFMVAGADKIGGNIIVYTPSKERAKKELDKLELESGNIVIVTTNGEIFGKKGREMIMAIDNNGVMKKAWLEAVPVVGVIYVQRKR